jgi:hypothetical protein
MKTVICTLLLLCGSTVMAQKTVTVKKGEIKMNGEVVATYDGKGCITNFRGGILSAAK